MHAHGEKIGPSPKVTVRPMLASDVSAAQSILKESPQASMWSKESLLEWAMQRSAWVAELDGCVAGILFGRVVADECEILNLAVGESSRRRSRHTFAARRP